MKALTLHQPWATLVALEVKTIETRSWAAPKSLIGQRIAIHAGVKRPADVWHHNVNSDPVFPPELSWLYERGMCCDPLEHGNNEAWQYRWSGPLGCVVATAKLEACVPIMDCNDGTHHLCVSVDDVLEHWPLQAERDGIETERVCQGQRPYGDYTATQPPRYGWVLTDIEPLTKPIPAKGKQGLWNWNAS